MVNSELAHNYEVATGLQQYYSQNRGLTVNEKTELVEVIHSLPGNKQLKHLANTKVFTKYSKIVTLKDMRNMKKTAKIYSNLSKIEDFLML